MENTMAACFLLKKKITCTSLLHLNLQFYLTPGSGYYYFPRPWLTWFVHARLIFLRQCFFYTTSLFSSNCLVWHSICPNLPCSLFFHPLKIINTPKCFLWLNLPHFIPLPCSFPALCSSQIPRESWKKCINLGQFVKWSGIGSCFPVANVCWSGQIRLLSTARPETLQSWAPGSQQWVSFANSHSRSALRWACGLVPLYISLWSVCFPDRNDDMVFHITLAIFKLDPAQPSSLLRN